MTNILPYPEEFLLQERGTQLVQIHRPDQLMVVLGAGCRPEKDIFAPNLETDCVPLYKRKGGGGTVLLGPHCLVITVHAGVSHPFGHKTYFSVINRAIIETLNSLANLNYQEKGISDLAVDNRKIMGSSLYRKKGYLLFQGSLLVEDASSQIERYLQQPPRQPDYREQRGHTDFITSLRQLGVRHSWNELGQVFDNVFPKRLHDLFDNLPEAYR